MAPRTKKDLADEKAVVKSQVDKMFDDLLGPTDNEEGDADEEAAETGEKMEEGEPVGDVPDEEADEDEDERDQEESGEEEGEEEDVEEEDGEELSDVDAMRLEMNEMARRKLGEVEPKVEKPTDDKKKPPEEKPPTEPAPRISLELDVSEDEWSGAMTDRDGFNAVLNKVDTAIEGKLQHLVRALPGVIDGYIRQVVDLRLAASDFYRLNEDLVPFKPLVSVVADEMFAKNQDKEPDELFKMVGEEVRRKLKIKKSDGSVADDKKGKKPAFVSKAGSRKPVAPKPTGMQAEIDEMTGF